MSVLSMRDAMLRAFKIQPGEGWRVFQFALLGAVMQSGVAVGMSTADALFLSHVGIDRLPYIYLLTPVLMMLYVPTYSYLLGRYGIDRVFEITLGLVIVGGIGFYIAVSNLNPHSPATTVVYFLAKLYSALWYIGLYTMFWNFTDSYFDILDGKRLYALFSGGGSFGAIMGGLIVAWVTRVAQVDHLFLVWAVLALATFPLMISIRRKHTKLEELEEAESGFRRQMTDTIQGMRSSSFVLVFSVLLLTTLLLTTINEYQYLAIFSQNTSERDLARLFGILYASVNIFNFFVNFFLFNRLVLRLGVRNAALIQPVTYIIAFTFLLLQGGLPAAVFAFFAYHGVLTSIDYNNQNFLFNAVPAAIKQQVRTIIEGLAEPVAIALGGAFLLLFATDLGAAAVSMIGLAIAGATFILALFLRAEYLSSMIIILKKSWLDLSSPADQALANVAEEMLPELRARALRGPAAATHAAIRILWVNDREIAVRTLLEYLEGATSEQVTDTRPLLTMMLHDKDGEVIRLLLYWLINQEQRLSPSFLEELGYHSLLQPRDVAGLFDSLDPDENAVAAVTSWNSWKPSDRLSALRALETLLHGDVASVRAGVRAIGRLGQERLAYYIVPHLRHAAPEIRSEAMVAIHRVATRDSSRLIPYLLAAIERGDEHDRVKGLETLAQIADPNCIPPLLRISDSFSPYEQRYVGRVLNAIGLKSVPNVVSVLEDARFSYAGRIIAARALGRVALPQLESISPTLIETEIRRAYQFAYFHDVLQADGAIESGAIVLSRFYRDMQDLIIDFILEILTIAGRLPDFELISSSLRSRNPKERGNAIETIEQGVSRAVFRVLLPLIEPKRAAERTALSKQFAERVWTGTQIVENAFNGPFPLESAAAAQALWEQEPQQAPDVLRDKFSENLYPLFRDTVLALFAKGGPEERLNTIEKLHRLAASRLFGLLTTRDLERLSLVSSERYFAPGEEVFAQGDDADELYLVASGSVRIGNGTSAQRTAGAVLGEECLFGVSHRRQSAVSEGVNMLVLRKSDVLRTASVSSRIGVELLGWRLDRAHALEA